MPTNDDVIHRISVLLSVLDEEASNAVLVARLPDEPQRAIRAELQELADNPAIDAEVDAVLGELNRIMALLDQVQGSHRDHGSTRSKASRGSQSSKSDELDLSSDKVFQPTEDPIADLERLHPLRLAGALKTETASATAMVLGGMSHESAGQVLPWLPEETRTAVFLKLNAAGRPPRKLVEELASATVRTALALDMEELLAEQEGNDVRIARLLRTISREDRARVMRAMDEQDADAANRIRAELYSFQDLLLVDDRSLQKVMAEVDSNTLAAAIKNADPEIRDRVLGTMSKRARETMVEEMEFMTSMTPEEETMATDRIVQAMLQLDESGELVLEE